MPISTSIRLFQNEDADKIVKLLNENVDFGHFGNKTTIEKFNESLDEPNEEIRENTFVVWDGKKVKSLSISLFCKK